MISWEEDDTGRLPALGEAWGPWERRATPAPGSEIRTFGFSTSRAPDIRRCRHLTGRARIEVGISDLAGGWSEITGVVEFHGDGAFHGLAGGFSSHSFTHAGNYLRDGRIVEAAARQLEALYAAHYNDHTPNT